MALIAPGLSMSPDSENFVPVNPGDVIADKYRVERVLGRGGMGIVVAATHLHLDQPVAHEVHHPRCRRQTARPSSGSFARRARRSA